METTPNNPQLPEVPKERTAQQLAQRGLDLMVKHQNLVSLVGRHELDVEKLLEFTQGLSEQDFDLMVAAEQDAARRRTKAQTRAMVLAYGEPVPTGRA